MNTSGAPVALKTIRAVPPFVSPGESRLSRRATRISAIISAPTAATERA
jgi:hypothetical protein